MQRSMCWQAVPSGSGSASQSPDIGSQTPTVQLESRSVQSTRSEPSQKPRSHVPIVEQASSPPQSEPVLRGVSSQRPVVGEHAAVAHTVS